MRRRTSIIFIGLCATIQIYAHVDLNYPRGEELFKPGDTVQIIWTEVVKHNTLNWDLLFSEDGGSTWNKLRENIPLEQLNYQWIVPGTSTMKAKIRIIQDNVGDDYESTSQNFTIASITGIAIPLNSDEIRVWPNPVTDLVNIEFRNPGSGNHTLTLYNTLGEMVLSISEITSERIRVSTGNLPAGYYILQLIDDHQLRLTGRLVVK